MNYRELWVLRKIKICALLILLVCLVTVSVLHTSEVYAERAGGDVLIEATGGFDGIAKLGAWSRVEVKVCSLNKNISGEIEVEVNTDQARRVIFSKPVELTAGIEQEVSFEVPVITVKKNIDIRFRENKKVLAETTCNFKRLLPSNVLMIGVLSEDSDAFNWLNGNTVPASSGKGAEIEEKIKALIASGQLNAPGSIVPVTDDYFQKHEAVVIPLDRNSFPDRNEIMDSFDILMISRYDTSLLDDSQVSVLEEWVEAGGLLILGTGISWQKVYHGLPESLKPFPVTGTGDVNTSETIEKFTGRDADGINLKLAQGELDFMHVINNLEEDYRYLMYDNYIIAGDMNNPVAIKYRKENGAIVVLTFDPSVEPFVSWSNKTAFMENIFRYTATVIRERFYDNGSGYYRRYSYQNTGMQGLANDVPFDKVPPFRLMFIILAVYVILAGPVLYVILKLKDKRDWAWVLIPVLSVSFLAFMYVFGYKTRYNTAIVNTASLVEIRPGSDKAFVSSSIGVFNNRRGTLTVEYDNNNGVLTPFIEQNYNYWYGREDLESKVVAKYTMGDRIKLEQYNVSLWTPKILYAEKTIPFDGSILDNITIKDGRIRGIIENSTPYDLLDAVLIIGSNIVRIGDIVAWDSVTLDIPFDSADVYKQPELYLDAVYGKNWYSSPKDYPENFLQLNQRRRLFESYIYNAYNNNRGKPVFTLLAMNEQDFEYGLTVNSKAPQKYNKNLFRLDSALRFEPGQEVEIPAGIIVPSLYQAQNVAWYDTNNILYVRNTGDFEFEFVLPENVTATEMRIYAESFMPIAAKYGISQGLSGQSKVLPNKYKFYLYNVTTKTWDEIEADKRDGYIFDIIINSNVSQYIGSGNEVRLKISVIELGMSDFTKELNVEYYEEMLTVPEIYIKGVSE